MNRPPPPASGIRDNRDRGSAGQYIAEHLTEDTELSIVSAFFTIHAYGALKDKLDGIGQLRFLFGEPRFLGSLEPDKASRAFHLTNREGLSLSGQMRQRRLARECAAWIGGDRVEVKSIKQAGLLHGKMYHMRNRGDSHALLGSSNFTLAGLGLGSGGNNNVELNLVVDSRRDLDDLLAWFNEWWADDERTEDVKETVLRELNRLHRNQTPQFVYYLTLYHVFREVIDAEDLTGGDLQDVKLPDTGIWRALYGFQKDGAKAAINKIRGLGGCILADSVGLGKTFTALAVIKYFELRNERVLVLCPKKLRRNWTLYRNNEQVNPFNDDRFRYDVLSHTDLSRTQGKVGDIELATLNWGNYDLVVIDESHNFRNNNRTTEAEREQGKRTRYEKLIDDVIHKGVNTRVLLLSATPVNNELSDLRNQISVIAGGDVTRLEEADGRFHDSLDISSVKETTRQAQTAFTEWAKQRGGRDSRELVEKVGSGFFKLLDGLSIARSRKQIRRYYREEMDKLGGFPERLKPEPVHPPIDDRDDYLSFEALSDGIDGLTLALYHPSAYLRADLPEETAATYDKQVIRGFTQEGRERILIGMMKVNFLKRLESSVHSFRLTLDRTIDKMANLERTFDDFERQRTDAPELDYDLIKPEDLDDPEMDDDFIVGGKQKFHLGHIDIGGWRAAIEQDRERLQYLRDRTRAVTAERDAKLARLREEIHAKLRNPTTDRDGRKNHKVLVFTAFADTAEYLYENLEREVRERGHHAALIRGDGGNRTTLGHTDYDEILTNFSPVSKWRAEQPEFPQQEEIDLLIATDCISEGQNLQDCDLLINYDIHWNPVRIIQRFGRIDRIGSRNHRVRLINFWPVQDLDRYLKVKHRVEARMALVDLAATQTDNLLEDDRIKELVTDDLRFRDRQLERLREEILDLEDFDDAVSLGDFSLEEFRAELLRFLESRREELESAGLGLYAVVPPEGNPIAQPGAIFCLRHRQADEADAAAGPGATAGARDGEAATNPLGRYYLLYVLDDGTVRLTFAQPKQALTLLRDLAAGHDQAFQDLCDLFDNRTGNGADMNHYDRLIGKALESIKQVHGRRALQSLAAGRGGKLPKASESPTDSEDDYELVTWFVILDPDAAGSQ